MQLEKAAKQVILGTVYELQFFLTVKATTLSPGRNFEMLLSLAEDKIMDTGYLGGCGEVGQHAVEDFVSALRQCL